MTIRNSREDELKRERRSLLGKMDRRHRAITEAQGDIREFRERLSVIERALDEYRRPRTRASDV